MAEHVAQRRKPPVLKTHWQVQSIGGRQDNRGGDDNRWEQSLGSYKSWEENWEGESSWVWDGWIYFRWGLWWWGFNFMACFLLLLSFHCSVVSNCLWAYGPQHARTPLSLTISWSLPKFISIESVMLFNHLILCCCLLLLPSKGMPPFPASGSFPVTRLLASGAQRLGLQHQSFQWVSRADFP